jgi:hypothetical protein
MKKIALAAAALAISATPALAAAQKAPAKAAAKPAAKPAADAPISKEQQDHAVQDFSVLTSAMRSDKVGNDLKSALMGCIYSNPLSTISTAIDGVIKDNPGKVDRANADQVLGVMAVVCGYEPPAGAAAATPTPAPTTSGAAPVVGPVPGR